MQSECVVWTVIFSGLLLLLNVLIAENQGGPQNVGGRKIGMRPEVKEPVNPGDQKMHAPPIGSDVTDHEDAKDDEEPKTEAGLSAEDLKMLASAQQLDGQKEGGDSEPVIAETEQNMNGENVQDPSNSQVKNADQESSEKATSGKAEMKNGEMKKGEKATVIYLGHESDEVRKNSEHSEKEGEQPIPTCVDCETVTEEKKAEVKSDSEAEIEKAPSQEKVAEAAVQPEEAVAKETDTHPPEQDAKPPEGETAPSDKETPQVEELSTVNLPLVENKLEVDVAGGTETLERVETITEPAATDVETENKDGDITAPTQDSDMPSFDEWKKRMLAEQAQQEKSKQLEAQIVNTSSGSGNKKSGKGRNYASLNCGAKILATNPEAQNTGSVLSENRDSYIIQPCKAKKWFVVELCEPVQVRSLEIANLELFSSLPEKFVVNISDRFPTKEWKTLGTFHARDERAIQSFSVEDVDIYAKYIRIEMLSHYGREHYCPLTILRVFGTTVEEDDDGDHADNDSSSEDSADSEEGVDEPVNLFSTATGTVLSLVKTVLSPSEKEGQAVDMEGIVALNGTATNQSAVNVTEPPPTEEEKKEPCAPSGNMDDKEKDRGVAIQQVTKPETPDPAMFVNGNVPQGDQAAGGSTGSPTVAKQEGAAEAEEEEVRLVTLIESPISLNTVLSKCHYCEKPGGTNECYFDTSSACGYYKFLKYVYPTCCHHKGKIIHEVPTPLKAKPKGKAQEDQGDQKGVKPSEDIPLADISNGGAAQATLEESLKPSRVTSSYEAQSSKPTESLSLTKVSQSDGTAATEGVVDTPETIKQSKTSIEITATPTASVVDSEPACDSKGDATDVACNIMGPSVVQIRPTATEEDTSTVSPTPTLAAPEASVETRSGQEAEVGQGQEKAAVTPEDIKPPPPEPTERVIHAEEAVDTEFDQVPMADAEQELIKYSSEKKQTTFMKLKNRIKMLELNLNLSSRYLEELSQRYKRQMEEMYISLNRTITKLTNTSKSAEARDLKQQEHISQLQKKIANLTTQLSSLTSSIANIHSEVIERHLFLMLIELAVFTILFTWCVNRNTRKEDTRLQVVEIKEPVEQKRVQNVTPKKQVLKRRNSIGSSPSEKSKEMNEEELTARRSVDDLAIRRSGSEGTFGIIDPSSNVFINQNPDEGDSGWKDQVPKRRKKKNKAKISLGTFKNSSSSDLFTKQSSQTSSSSSVTQDGDSFSDFERRSSSFTSWAGVLFGRPKETPSVNWSKQDVVQPLRDGSKERHKDRRKPFKGRRSLDSHLSAQANGSASYTEIKTNGHKSSHINGDLASSNSSNYIYANQSNGLSQRNGCDTIGRLDLTNSNTNNSVQETKRKSTHANGSPGYHMKEGAWKSFH